MRESEIDDETLILTMTEAHKSKIIDDYLKVMNVYTIKEYTGENGDVVDPYGGTLVEYEDCYVELARLVKKTVYKISEDNQAN